MNILWNEFTPGRRWQAACSWFVCFHPGCGAGPYCRHQRHHRCVAATTELEVRQQLGLASDLHHRHGDCSADLATVRAPTCHADAVELGSHHCCWPAGGVWHPSRLWMHQRPWRLRSVTPFASLIGCNADFHRHGRNHRVCNAPCHRLKRDPHLCFPPPQPCFPAWSSAWVCSSPEWAIPPRYRIFWIFLGNGILHWPWSWVAPSPSACSPSPGPKPAAKHCWGSHATTRQSVD